MTAKRRSGWMRVAPGHYEMTRDFRATIERSAARPWAWWWHVWGTSRSGIEPSLAGAKSRASAAGSQP